MPRLRPRVRIPSSAHGDVAEWLRSGLQNRLHEFDSRRRLKKMIAITGSGEFLPGIKNADKSLFSTIDNPYVLSFSTAAGKESIERQEYWKNLALNHFKSLGLRHKHIEAKNKTAQIEHEATTSKIGEDQIFYCNQRGIDTEKAIALIVNGFSKEVLNKLPMEFAVEAQKLLEISLEGSVG